MEKYKNMKKYICIHIHIHLHIHFPESAKTLAASRCISLKPSTGVGGGVWGGGGVGISSDLPPPCMSPSGDLLADHAGTSWRSWTSSWSQDCPILSLCCRRMTPRWPNIAQDSIKMSKQWLREGPTRPSSMLKSFQNAVLSFVS